jgi:hypothetical protein
LGLELGGVDVIVAGHRERALGRPDGLLTVLTLELDRRASPEVLARVYDSFMPRDAFSGDDELLNVEGEPDEALKVLLGDEVGEGDPDVIEPVMDE